MGFPLFLQTPSCLEVAVPVYGVSRSGFLLLLLDHASVDFPFPPRTHARLGPALLAYGLTRPDSPSLTADFVSLGFLPSLHGSCCTDSMPLAYGITRLGFLLLTLDFLLIGSSLLPQTLACPGLPPSALWHVTFGLFAITARSFADGLVFAGSRLCKAWQRCLGLRHRKAWTSTACPGLCAARIGRVSAMLDASGLRSVRLWHVAARTDLVCP